MARDPNIERRLINWARWMEGAGDVGLGYGSGSMWDRVRVDCSPNRQSVIPTNAVEAEQTDRAIKSLPTELIETVHLHYAGRGTTVAAMAATLGCAVSTLHWRIGDAHRRITVWVSDREREAAARRQIEEQVQQVARTVRLGAAVELPMPTGKVERVKARKNGPVTTLRPELSKVGELKK